MVARPYEDFVRAYRPNEIVYGLNFPRRDACALLTPPGFAAGQIRKHDTLNNALFQVGGGYVFSRFNDDAFILEALGTNAEMGFEYAQFLTDRPRYDVRSRKPLHRPFRPLCKAGLEFHVRAGRTVHVIVEGILETIAEIVSKVGKGVSVTSCEFRWLYRHRHVTDVVTHVRFWKKDGEMGIEEFSSLAGWSTYEPKHLYDADWTRTPNPARRTASSLG